MNKSELIDTIATKADLSKSKAEEALNATIDAVTTALQKGDEVKLIGFGTFKVSNRAATTGRNPRTGEAIDIPASKQAKFVAGKALKDAVNEK
jgi:DNA-binding protein HU-beta